MGTIYLEPPRVIQLYAGIFHCTVHEARDQLRNPAGLEGALDRPKWYAHYDQADIPLQAAVLAHGIAETQPFIEGNKRVALAVMLTFLELNRYWVKASQDQLATWMLDLARGTTVEHFAEQIRTSCDCLWDEADNQEQGR